jgi:hypothetical protein
LNSLHRASPPPLRGRGGWGVKKINLFVLDAIKPLMKNCEAVHIERWLRVSYLRILSKKFLKVT